MELYPYSPYMHAHRASFYFFTGVLVVLLVRLVSWQSVFMVLNKKQDVSDTNFITFTTLYFQRSNTVIDGNCNTTLNGNLRQMINTFMTSRTLAVLCHTDGHYVR